LQHIAVNQNLALTQFNHIYYPPQATPNQALNLVGASTDLSYRRFTRSTGMGRTGQHRVLGGQPTHTFTYPKGRQFLINRSSTQNAGLAKFNKGRTFSPLGVMWRNAYFTQLIGQAPVFAGRISLRIRTRISQFLNSSPLMRTSFTRAKTKQFLGSGGVNNFKWVSSKAHKPPLHLHNRFYRLGKKSIGQFRGEGQVKFRDFSFFYINPKRIRFERTLEIYAYSPLQSLF
jgi:hypothetical protein